MVETPSTFSLALGERTPDFALRDGEGRSYALSDFSAASALVVAFVCNHCPFVVHIADAFGECSRDYAEKGVAFVAISSNDVANYPADDPAKMPGFARKHGWKFPYLYDESQAVAKAYGAACTPDLFLFDARRELFYAGQFDSSRPGNSQPVNGRDLRAALDALLGGQPAPDSQLPSTGCNIKWKPGNEPPYFG